MRGNLRDRWRLHALRTPLVSDSVRVLLIALADDMDPDARVTMSRKVYAQRLDKSERRISERLEQAVRARLLDHVVKGAPGRLPVYVGLLADANGERVRPKAKKTAARPSGVTDVRPADGGHSHDEDASAGVTDVRLADCSTSTGRTGVTPTPRSEGGRPPGGRGSHISTGHPSRAHIAAVPASGATQQRNEQAEHGARPPASPAVIAARASWEASFGA